jgi:sterol desaturase/sphingolipid hydroxylase (fatty acid hydroxylase superfamily)
MSVSNFIAQHETTIRLSFFFGVFAVMAAWEVLAPRRALALLRTVRWTSNLGLVMLNSMVLRLLFPAAAMGVAALVAENGWGLLNVFDLPFVLAMLLSIVAMDFVIYLQHMLMHAAPALWRVHRVHHADLDYDLTTGARFHPIEIMLSMLIKFVAIVVLGPPVVAVVIFEVVLNAMALFNHGNVRLPVALDKILRLLVVTPDMHRVHHSVEDHEANSNFGFNLSIWDRLFGTYIDQPRGGHQGMTIGIHQYRDPKQVDQLPGMLMLPFKGDVTRDALNRREWSQPDAN